MREPVDRQRQRHRMTLTFSVTNRTNHSNYSGFSGVVSSDRFMTATSVMNPRMGISVGF
jgi:hypothetical protein